MESSVAIFFIFASFLVISGVRGDGEFRAKKLFVFGDSYADTGNVKKSQGGSWKKPYGFTLPGRPAGRFSDGLILTDFLGKFLRIKTPLGYVFRNYAPKEFSPGMNFAFGGSGVFVTYPSLPNMTTQIGFFEQLLAASFYTKKDLESAVVLVTCAGNDYAAYLAKGGSIAEVKNFIPRVVNELVANLRRIHELGAGKIVVAGLQPLGCLPRMTAMMGYKNCVGIQNLAVGFHNGLLEQAVQRLNGGKERASTFLFLDMYQAFENAIATGKDHQGKVRFAAPLTPCCTGTDSGSSCGSVDGNGTALYTVCSEPKEAFFWDANHPTDAGWRTVFSLVRKSLDQFLAF